MDKKTLSDLQSLKPTCYPSPPTCLRLKETFHHFPETFWSTINDRDVHIYTYPCIEEWVKQNGKWKSFIYAF
jgi:hypothetical protein